MTTSLCQGRVQPSHGFPSSITVTYSARCTNLIEYMYKDSKQKSCIMALLSCKCKLVKLNNCQEETAT